ncbi:hypothetical protein PFICI_00298 [Pestalotiopsis fici W106-1]|uniref:Serine hydrolase domain-containing protein n=1 Tax=Pestalotiopsis fici (strain W106-1 / CGMCC3.15140) TaxID=1229662 RepID=W3XKE3_PESFW|nr:uncharacterized protein PFICI_00298 [Pestalotiopsis fici W106-1]ETS86470.1 hypothetical protein PFICI_00298 [Pestalotiopsis fici W106-1]
MGDNCPPHKRPKILCFHGSGSSGAIYQAQGRKLFRALEKDFQFVYFDAPFPSVPGPGMRPAYEDSGPFFRWQSDDKAFENFDITEEEVYQEKQETLNRIMRHVENGGDEPFVGIFAFSQGARVATGFLRYIQKRHLDGATNLPLFKFIVLNSGTYPPLTLEEDTEFTDGFKALEDKQPPATRPRFQQFPLASIHVQGLYDPWRAESSKLLGLYDSQQSSVIEFRGGHQVPVTDKDTNLVVKAVREMYEKIT